MQRLLPPVLTLVIALAGCVGPPAPPPVTVAAPAPRPVAAPVAPPLASDWRDWPITAGDWRLERGAVGVTAIFATSASPLLSLSCTTGGRVRLARVTPGAGTMTVRTTSLTRALTTDAAASLPANDPLLDAIGFSRGRFVVEGPGAPPLVVPAWAEILRLVEECRG